MNGDKITVVAAKLQSAHEQRKRIIEDETESLRCLNQVLLNSKDLSASEKFMESLQALLDN